jgi:hypothetical protein
MFHTNVETSFSTVLTSPRSLLQEGNDAAAELVVVFVGILKNNFELRIPRKTVNIVAAASSS